MTTTHPTSRPWSFVHAPFVLVNDDTNEQLMPVHNHDPLAPLTKFIRSYPHLALRRNPGFRSDLHTCGLMPEDPCIDFDLD